MASNPHFLQPMEDTMKSPPVLSDQENEARAAETRAEGVQIVEDHLDRHLDNNTGRSADYVTWIATLHPENADVAIDERFFIPGNPWWTIYEHAKAELPSATAVEVVRTDEEKMDEENRLDPPVPPPKPHDIYLCSPINMLVGFTIAMGAILGVLITEIMAFGFYIGAFILFWIAEVFSPDNMFTRLFHSIFMMAYSICSLADSICLLTSVLVTELLAGVCWLVSILFAGVWMANHWHQYIRRICHVIRGAFRSPFEKPPRHFALLCMTSFTGTAVEAQTTNTDVHQASIPDSEVTAYEVYDYPDPSGK